MTNDDTTTNEHIEGINPTDVLREIADREMFFTGENASEEDGNDREQTHSTLKEAIKEQATEDEKPLSASITLRKILGGEFFSATMIRRQIWVFSIIVAFTLIYVSNRYSCQKDILEISKLKKELEDAKYKSLASSSELTEMCRESNVLNMLHNNKDSLLHIANQPPYIINVPEE